jgi:hypothetical protein
MLVAGLFSFFTVAVGIQDSFNFILPPGGKECMFDNIQSENGIRSVEVFVPSGSNVNLMLEVLNKELSNLIFNQILFPTDNWTLINGTN